jgi:outer membrane protein OmpA-like peptidoglycan-associated protein
MKATAITAFGIVGLMYIFQEHSIEMKKSNAVIETYKKQQNILESNLTTLIKKEDIFESEKVQLLSNLKKVNLKYKTELKSFNQLLTKKDTQIEEESNRTTKLLLDAQEKIAQLLTVDKMKTFDDILNRQDSLEANITAQIEIKNQLKEKNQDLQARIGKMLEIADDATKKAISEHQQDMDEYQSLLSMYKSLESNLSIEIERENILKEEKRQLQLEIKEGREKELALKSKLTQEIAKEDKLKEELTEEIEKEDALKAELNATIQKNSNLVEKDKKIEFEMSELLFISKDSRDNTQKEHEVKVKELEQQLAVEIEKEQNLEANLTSQIEKESLLKEEKDELEARLTSELEIKSNLESNLSVELEREKVLLEEKSQLEAKIAEQIAIFDEASKKEKLEHEAKVKELQSRLSSEREREKLLESNLTSQLEKEKALIAKKDGLELEIAKLITIVNSKKEEIATQKESQATNLAKIEELTKKRDELEQLAKERATEITEEKEATNIALLDVQKAKDEMQNLLKEIADKKKAEEERLLQERQKAEDTLLEAFKLTNVEFEINSMNLTKKSKELLNTTAEVMKKYPNFSYNIQGHTDSRGNEEFNIKLSGQRARQVKKYLIIRGIREDILSTEGIGSAQPIADNETEEGRIINRRVVFDIIKE